MAASRQVWTAATIGGVVLVAVVAWRAGSYLDDRLDDETAAVLQSAVVTVVGAAAAIVLITLWDLTDDIRIAFLPAINGTTAVRAMVSLLVLAAVHTLTRITKRFVRHGYRRDAITRHQREVGHHLLQLVLYSAAILVLLAFWGVKPSNLLIGAGAVGLVVGLAARQTLRSVLAGFVLIGSRPFQIGDWVIIADVEGEVTDVSVFNTRVRTFDGEVVAIPNDAVTDTHVINRSATNRLRIAVEVGIDYDADIARAMQVAEEAVADLDMILAAPEPDVVIERLGDSAVVMEVRFWIADPTVERKWSARNAVVETLKTALAEADVAIPFPQLEISDRNGVDSIPPTSTGSPDTEPAHADEPAADHPGDRD